MSITNEQKLDAIAYICREYYRISSDLLVRASSIDDVGAVIQAVEGVVAAISIENVRQVIIDYQKAIWTNQP